MQPDLLSQLKDIQTPENIGNWPLAWGWWIIIAACCVLITIALITTYLFLKKRKAKKQALKLLSQLDSEQNPIQTVQTINNVLKRVMLAYCPRDEVANLTGDKWSFWLNNIADKSGNENTHINQEFMQLAYKSDCNPEQASEYLTQVQNWINKNLPLSSQQHSTSISNGKGEQHV